MVSQNVITLLLPLFLWCCKIKSVCFVAARLRVLATIRQGALEWLVRERRDVLVGNVYG